MDNWLTDNSGGNGGPGVYFGTVGALVVGNILGKPRVVETEYGQRYVIEISALTGCTALKGTSGSEGPIAEGDTVTVWVKPGAMAAAVNKALTAAGATEPVEGGKFALVYTADGERTKPGFNPPKLYEAQYKAPAASVLDASEF